ncbi:DUF3298/DUF4163 domain-containing protein [Novosphingobium umbonatum]|uniref:DUF3298/DUF4163 domain-containing protein n=1 Tax=Novosphingobium umbonatum TaxID=1908524 RepID=A0A437NCE7_9SPHN|nr:DUF4163 domain-containing protein [Novosphingobium umbonatum]RVU07628.1 DUF3298/DUF4163 domain-containing protein [Novosphingobium umbonatum]
MLAAWRIGLLAGAALVLTACGKGEATAPTAAASSAGTAPQPPAPPVPVAGVARKVHEETKLYAFDYSYPAAAEAIPALKSWLEADMAKQKADLAQSAKEGAADAKQSGFDYRPYASGMDWKVVADLPQWLSLSASVYSDTGGAHPNHGTTALLWDKAAGQQRKVVDLFTSPAAFTKVLQPAFCDALDAQRAKRRGAKVNRNSGDEFDACLDPASVTVILGSAKKQGFDRIGFLIDPYAAGPYAEGDYEVTLPVTDKVPAAVKPQFRAAFATGK